jgi:hypothetical protein
MLKIDKSEIKPCGMDKSRYLANEYWDFLQRWMQMVFTDGFMHGYKHGSEDANSKRTSE